MVFTGIVRGLLKVAALERKSELLRLALSATPYALEGLQLGASISVDGVCLTVIAIEGHVIWFDVIPETLTRTTLGSLNVGELVNIERAARYGDEIGGHLLSGHVMGTAEVLQLQQFAEHSQLTCRVPIAWIKYLPLKGFVAINGSSLTIASVNPEGEFSVHLIPETLRQTNLSLKKCGQKLNIEIDSHTQILVDAIATNMEPFMA